MLSVQTFSALISQYLPEPHAGLLSGILFGIKATLTPDLKNALIATGTLHIVALSGMNITILTKMVLWVFLHIINRKIACILTIMTIVGFVMFVGPSPSVVRAAIMGSVTLLGVLFGRQMTGIASWCIAVGIMIVISPGIVFELAFQLSGLASLGIVLFDASETDDRALKLFSFLRSELHTTLAAQVFTIPLLFFVFQRISFISPLTNVLIGWTIPVITVLGMMMSVVGSIWFPLGRVVSWVAWVFLEYVINVILWTSVLPWASVGR